MGLFLVYNRFMKGERVKTTVRFGASILGIIFCLVLVVHSIVTYGEPRKSMVVTAEELNEVEAIIGERRAELAGENPIAFTEGEVNVLLLGIDSRKEGDYAHCDAIHMFSLQLDDWSIDITSVPRGTIVPIPGHDLPKEDYYLANACFYKGIDYGARQIAYVTGKQPDYIATVGFSGAQGILRLFQLPPSSTLQWLRHRRSYAIGEPQRTHNQALFMKDLIINHTDRFRSVLSVPMLFAAYQTIDTDMPYGLFKTLALAYTAEDIDKRPDDIRLAMRPYYETVDIHYSEEQVEADLEKWLEAIKPYTTEEDFSGKSLAEFQEELIGYIQGALKDEEEVMRIYEERLWLQIDDKTSREQIHRAVIESYLPQVSADERQKILTNFILEKEALGLVESADWGREQLDAVLQ
jgi:hypothetical protein